MLRYVSNVASACRLYRAKTRACQEDAAHSCGVSVGTWRRWERTPAGYVQRTHQAFLDAFQRAWLHAFGAGGTKFPVRFH
jgi:hypothetical protein